jgi:hypothetical protein
VPLLAQSWAGDLLARHPPTTEVLLQLPPLYPATPRAAGARGPPALTAGGTSPLLLRCRASPHLLPTPALHLHPAPLCPCHGQPLLSPGNHQLCRISGAPVLSCPTPHPGAPGGPGGEAVWVCVGGSAVLQVPGAVLAGVWGGEGLTRQQQEGAVTLQLEALVREVGRRGGRGAKGM